MTRFMGNMALFETWYDLMAPFTPKSRWYALTPEEQAVVPARIYDHLLKDDPYYAVMFDRPATSGLDEATIIAALGEKIAGWLDGQPYFFRTNLLSPKDAGLCRVENAEDVLDLLLRSRRLYRVSPVMGATPLTLVFREWCTPYEEFRCFVENGRIKALSQYDDSDSIMKANGASEFYPLTPTDYVRLATYIQAVVDTTHLDTAVLDVARGDDGFWVVEINPFSPITDTCLFVLEDIYDTPLPDPEIRYWVGPFIIGRLTYSAGRWHVRAPLPVSQTPPPEPWISQVLSHIVGPATPVTSLE